MTRTTTISGQQSNLFPKTNFSRILSSSLCSERQMSLLSRFWRVRFCVQFVLCLLSSAFLRIDFWGSRSSRRFSEILTLFPFIWIAIMLNRCSSIFKVINQPFWPLFWLLLLLMALAAEEAYIFVIKPPFLSPCFALCTNLITLSRGCVLHFGLLCNATCPHKKSGKYIIQHIEKRGWMVIENRYRQ